MARLISTQAAALAAVLVAGPFAGSAVAQVTKQPQPGFNLFSVEQDIEIGRSSAIEAERQLRLLNNRTTDRYLTQIITRLAAVAPGARYPYQIKAVNAAEINAFALPGGPMYVHRGLIEAARSEAELAGVLSHEMAHVALRHGTHQASKAYLTESGLGILGGLLGKRSGSTAKILSTIGGVGLNALFLKFSRDDEYEADQVGAQIMAQAGYDPVAMASFFELLKTEQNRNPSKLEQFFSSHPPAVDREARIRQLAASLGGGGRTQLVGGFDGIRSSLTRLPAATQSAVAINEPVDQTPAVTGPVTVQVAAPSSRFVQFAQTNGFFTLSHPDNWQAYASGHAVSLAPEGGVVATSDGRQVMVYGVIVNHYAPFAGTDARLRRSIQRSYAPFEDRTRPRASLEDATDDLVRTILESNTYLRNVDERARPEVIDGASGFSMLLSGISPVTGVEERVTVYTRGLSDGHVLYALSIVPGTDANAFDPIFDRMIRSLNVDDAAAHRSTRISQQ